MTLDVLFKLLLTSEMPQARSALELLLSSVPLAVGSHVAAITELHQADLALVRLLFCVFPQVMLLQLPFSGELHRALSALERSFPIRRVCFDVRLVSGAALELLAAVAAL